MFQNILRYIDKFINKRCYVAILFCWLYTGFGQFYNKQYLKGLLFGIFNFFNNQDGHLNQAMMFRFVGDIEAAKLLIDYQWILTIHHVLLFLNGMLINMVLRDNSKKPPISHSIPFILAAMLSTLGIVYGVYTLGPIFSGGGCFWLGLALGALIIKVSKKYR